MNILGCFDRPTSGKYFLAGEDVSRAIRDEAIGVAASRVAAIPEVREALGGTTFRFGNDRRGNAADPFKDFDKWFEENGFGNRRGDSEVSSRASGGDVAGRHARFAIAAH